MRLIEHWQYKWIERGLYDHKKKHNRVGNEQLLYDAIEEAQVFFAGRPNEKMMVEYYFRCHEKQKKYTARAHFRKVCEEVLFVQESNGYYLRREVVYKVAMICFRRGLFSQ